MASASPPALRLLVFAPSFGAPSLDPECTKAYAYLLFCGLKEGADFSVEGFDNWRRSLGADLPVLEMCSTGQLAEGPTEVCAALAKSGHDLDANLTPEQRAESLAFTALIEERLNVALLYAWWEDETNYDTVVRPALSSTLPVPLCYYLPWTMRRRVKSQLARRRCGSAEIAYGHGEAALAALSVRLGSTRPYFHGDKPSAVDASAFAYLSAVLRCPLPNERLRAALQQHPNLVSYVERISGAQFGGSAPLLARVAAPAPRVPTALAGVAAYAERQAADAAAAAAAKADGGGKTPRTPKQEAFRRRSRNAVLGAAGATVLYALATDALGLTQDKDGADSADEQQ